MTTARPFQSTCQSRRFLSLRIQFRISTKLFKRREGASLSGPPSPPPPPTFPPLPPATAALAPGLYRLQDPPGILAPLSDRRRRSLRFPSRARSWRIGVSTSLLFLAAASVVWEVRQFGSTSVCESGDGLRPDG